MASIPGSPDKLEREAIDQISEYLINFEIVPHRLVPPVVFDVK